jgi:hypothetical protein
MIDARKKKYRIHNIDGVTSCVYHVNTWINTNTRLMQDVFRRNDFSNFCDVLEIVYDTVLFRYVCTNVLAEEKVTKARDFCTSSSLITKSLCSLTELRCIYAFL